MKLTREEKQMLDGKRGAAVQKAMEILVALGECYDAKEMIHVGSAHLVPCNPSAAGKGGVLFYKDMAEKGAKFVIPVTTNPACLDSWAWKEMGFPEEMYQGQVDLSGVIAKMGGFLCNTCTPYVIGHTPRTKEHVAWGESSAVVYINGVLGGRTNREGTPSALASGLTGRTPAYGYHLDRNRYGKLKVRVTADLKGATDYATLGYYTGKIAQDRVPIFTGLPSLISQQELICLSAGLASSGSVSHFHAVGLTPEAPTEKAASGANRIKPSDTFRFGPKELKRTEESLSKAAPEEANLVILGCPHLTIGEIRKYAEMLAGRTVKNHVEMWILTQHTIKKYAEDIGIADAIESTGARLVSNTCPSAIPIDYYKKHGLKAFATDSPKMAYLLSGAKKLSCFYGSLDTFLDVVTSHRK